MLSGSYVISSPHNVTLFHIPIVHSPDEKGRKGEHEQEACSNQGWSGPLAQSQVHVTEAVARKQSPSNEHWNWLIKFSFQHTNFSWNEKIRVGSNLRTVHSVLKWYQNISDKRKNGWLEYSKTEIFVPPMQILKKWKHKSYNGRKYLQTLYLLEDLDQGYKKSSFSWTIKRQHS